ncbi:hypothetical protein FB566_0509 [Stackebrandtia endophytica]|uniref:Uncharacterized protein n=1 Tax=Stackebrandtia endophytica TaxID=1496996 RepID=A0A543AR06_9ACTN|nr:hypothetical protein [Stackebrandtia endophytica]TQL75017.1 hypothetical protein FB566_0509 [Stackebrandtia endophytica]
MSQDAPKDESTGTDDDAAGAKPSPDSDAASTDDGSAAPERKPSRLERRREKIRDEIERNRRGEYSVPTWVLVVVLIAVIVGWALLIILA